MKLSLCVAITLVPLSLAFAGTAISLPKELEFIPGAINGAILQREGKSLAVYGGPSGRHAPVEMLLLAESRRDAIWAAYSLAEKGAQVLAPEKETELLQRPGKFWAELREKRFHDYAQQTTRVPTRALTVTRSIKGGDAIAWRGLSIRAIETPGYTRGAVSYFTELAGKRIAFTGDLIRDDGKLQDLFSFQDAIPEAKIGGYHGWAARLGDLMVSLDRVAAEKPDLLVPLRGPIIDDPLPAIRRLQSRVRAVYSNYLSIDALRWYFKDEHIRTKAARVLGLGSPIEWMPMAETSPLPPEIIAISNSRLILAKDGAGFLVDCGGMNIIEELRKLRAAGKLTSLEHVFVTHYHDDHTDALPSLVAEFGAKIHACGSLVDLLEHPDDYRLPCLTKNPSPVTARHHDRDSWHWKEYRLTIYDFPGQTLHHNALLVESDMGWSAFFAGDSFTPTGIDDYCLQNRDFLRKGAGFFRCLDQLERLPPGCFILNQHVEPTFRFSPAQIAQMRGTLERRLPLLADLLPFDDPNFGLDDSWAAFEPYWLRVRPGETISCELRITNHSANRRTFRVVPHVPNGLKMTAPGSARIPSHDDGVVRMTLRASPDVAPGTYVVTADLAWDNQELREWVEAVVEVVP